LDTPSYESEGGNIQMMVDNCCWYARSERPTTETCVHVKE